MRKKRVTVELVDRIKEDLFDLVRQLKTGLSDCQYIDLRVEVGEGQAAVAQDGMMKASMRDYGLSYGARVIAGKRMFAPGYFGQTLEEIVKLTKGISKAVSSSDPRVKLNEVIAETFLARELFLSSEGANIDRAYALTQGLCLVVAQDDRGASQTHYDYLGHQRGFEILTDGI